MDKQGSVGRGGGRKPSAYTNRTPGGRRGDPSAKDPPRYSHKPPSGRKPAPKDSGHPSGSGRLAPINAQHFEGAAVNRLRKAFESLPIEFGYSNENCRNEFKATKVVDRLQPDRAKAISKEMDELVTGQRFDEVCDFLLWFDAGSRFLVLSGMDPQCLKALANPYQNHHSLDRFDGALFRAVQEAIRVDRAQNRDAVLELLACCSHFRGARLALQAGLADEYWWRHSKLSKGDQDNLDQIQPPPKDWPKLVSPQDAQREIKEAFVQGASLGLAKCRYWLVNVTEQLSDKGALLVKGVVAQMLLAYSPALHGSKERPAWSLLEQTEHEVLSGLCGIAEMSPALLARVPSGQRPALLEVAVRQAAMAQGAQRMKGLLALFNLRQQLCRVGCASDVQALGAHLRQNFDRLLKPNSGLGAEDRVLLGGLREYLEAEPAPVDTTAWGSSTWSVVADVFKSLPGIRWNDGASRYWVDEALHVDEGAVKKLRKAIECLVAQGYLEAASQCVLWLDAPSCLRLLSSLSPPCRVALAGQAKGAAREAFDVAVFCALQEHLLSKGQRQTVDGLLGCCSPFRGARLALLAGFADVYWRCGEQLSPEEREALDQVAPRPKDWLPASQALALPQQVQAAIELAFVDGPSSGLKACQLWLEGVVPRLSGVGALLMRGAVAQALGEHEPTDGWPSDARDQHQTLSQACWLAGSPSALLERVPDARQRLSLMHRAVLQAANEVHQKDSGQGVEGLQNLFRLQRRLMKDKDRVSEAEELRDYLLQALAALLGSEGPTFTPSTNHRGQLQYMREQLESSATVHFQETLAGGDLLGAAACVRELGDSAEAMDALTELIKIIRVQLGTVGITLDPQKLGLSLSPPSQPLTADEQRALAQRRRLTVDTILLALAWCAKAPQQPQCQLLMGKLPKMVIAVRDRDPTTQAATARLLMLCALPGPLTGSPKALRDLFRDYLDPTRKSGKDAWPARVRQVLSTDSGSCWLNDRLCDDHCPDHADDRSTTPNKLAELAVLMMTHPDCEDGEIAWLFDHCAARCDLRVALEAGAKVRGQEGAPSLWQDLITLAARMANMSRRLAKSPAVKNSSGQLKPGWRELYAFSQDLGADLIGRIERSLDEENLRGQTDYLEPTVDVDTATERIGVYLSQQQLPILPPEMLNGPLEFFQSMWLLSVVAGHGASVPGAVSRLFLRYRYPEASSKPRAPGAATTAAFQPWKDGDLARWWLLGQSAPELVQQAPLMNQADLLRWLPLERRAWLRTQLSVVVLNDHELAQAVLNAVAAHQKVVQGSFMGGNVYQAFSWGIEWAIAFVPAVQGLLRSRAASVQAFAGGITGPHARALAGILSAVEMQCPDEVAALMKEDPSLSWLSPFIAIERDATLQPLELPLGQGNDGKLQSKEKQLLDVLNQLFFGTGPQLVAQ